MSIFINKTLLSSFSFSGGERSVQLSGITLGGEVQITAYLKSANCILDLLLAVDAIRRQAPDTRIEIAIPYFPYARQDRVCNAGEALSVKVMADLINGLQCNQVTVYDPHSDVTPALLKNCRVLSVADIFLSTSMGLQVQDKKLALVSPDAGSEKRTRYLAQCLQNQFNTAFPVYYASKVRNVQNGEILSTTVHDVIVEKNLMIIDDICDGGKTFIELSKTLKDKGAQDIYLYVTHGIFSKGLALLKNSFKHVFCYHTFLKSEHLDPSFLTILEGKTYGHEIH